MKQASNAITPFVSSSAASTPVFQRKTFFKYPILFLVVGLSIMLTSFNKENLQNRSLKESHLKPPVPFKGQFTLSINFGTGVVTGTGTATHLGKFSALAYDNLSAFPLISGIETFTAANGDEIYITQNGVAQDIGNGMLQGDFLSTITGGTGRFEGATGHYKLQVLVSAINGTGSATFDGTISY